MQQLATKTIGATPGSKSNKNYLHILAEITKELRICF